MSEINYTSILDGVTLALKAEFPDSKILGGGVKQGLNPGDINVVMPKATHAKQLGARYARSPTLDVIYYPKNGAVECYAIADRIVAAIGSITTPAGDIVHCTDCKWELVDDNLHVLVQYDHHVYVPQDPVFMETLTIQQEG